MTKYPNLNFSIKDKIATVELNRPKKANALHWNLWIEIKNVFLEIDSLSDIRVVILKGAGDHFCSGIDLNAFPELVTQVDNEDPGRKAESLRRVLKDFQQSFSAIENCRKPVIAAIHSCCIGAGLDMISACDLRYATEDAYFSIKEIDIGMVADVGTLQRLPKIIPAGVVAEMAYTGRNMKAEEAKGFGLVNSLAKNYEELIQKVQDVATQIASKSPLAIRGTKEMLLYTRDHSVSEGLNYIATWNAGMLFSQDLYENMQAKIEKRKPDFAD